MKLITSITSNTRQKHTIVLGDGSSFQMTLYFIPMQYGWFIEELVYGNFTLKNFRISNGYSILRQYKNIIPFGLACISKEGREPSFQNDFSSGASELYLMESSEVDYYEGYLSE